MPVPVPVPLEVDPVDVPLPLPAALLGTALGATEALGTAVGSRRLDTRGPLDGDLLGASAANHGNADASSIPGGGPTYGGRDSAKGPSTVFPAAWTGGIRTVRVLNPA